MNRILQSILLSALVMSASIQANPFRRQFKHAPGMYLAWACALSAVAFGIGWGIKKLFWPTPIRTIQNFQVHADTAAQDEPQTLVVEPYRTITFTPVELEQFDIEALPINIAKESLRKLAANMKKTILDAKYEYKNDAGALRWEIFVLCNTTKEILRNYNPLYKDSDLENRLCKSIKEIVEYYWQNDEISPSENQNLLSPYMELISSIK